MKIAWILIVIVVIALVLVRIVDAPVEQGAGKNIGTPASSETEDITVVAEDLEIPWEITFLPNKEMLVTERPGRLVKIGADRQVIEVQGVQHTGEGGLQGMALHPDFSRNQFVYLYLTTQTSSGLQNRVERYRLEGATLEGRTVIIDGIPGAQIHDGGRIAFGPDGLLYITTGDAGNENEAQNQDSLFGSILRITDDGSIPAENPFGTAVYSYGHRNPQGIAWDDSGRLWATEHGRSGIRSGFDELNLIEPGANYGWPVVQGDEARDGLRGPAVHSGASTTWAPAGAVFWDGSIFFTGLRGESLYEADISDPAAVSVKAHLVGEFGRLRAVTIGPDDMFYISTSNQDGRGSINPGDDKIIRVDPEMFRN